MFNFIQKVVYFIKNYRADQIRLNREINLLHKRVGYMEMQITRCVRLKRVTKK